MPSSTEINPKLLAEFVEVIPLDDTLRGSFPAIRNMQRYQSGLKRFVSREEMTTDSTFRCIAGHLVSWKRVPDLKNQRLGVGTVRDKNGAERDVPVFVKTVHLLDPFRFVEGEYSDESQWLPNPQRKKSAAEEKISDPNNQAYVDITANALLSYLGGRGLMPAALEYYGAVIGIHESYMYDITADFVDLRKKLWFWEAVGVSGEHLRIIEAEGAAALTDAQRRTILSMPDDIDEFDSDFTCEGYEEEEEETSDASSGVSGWGGEELSSPGSGDTPPSLETSSSASVSLSLSSLSSHSSSSNFEMENIEIDSITDETAEASPTSLELAEQGFLEAIEECESLATDEDTKEAGPIQLLGNGNGGTDSGDDEIEDMFDICGCRVVIECKNMPVALIFLEAADGTLDGLLDDVESYYDDSLSGDGSEDETSQESADETEEEDDGPTQAELEDKWAAWLFQICTLLSQMQALLGLVHNDLHCNNIVWTKTDIDTLYYQDGLDRMWAVPTHGKLFKIIDFGRATFQIGEKEFISDDFYEGNDAEGQYNYGCIYDPSQPLIRPNPSFDLCRLAVSFFDTLFPETPSIKTTRRGGMPPLLSQEGKFKRYTTESPLYNCTWMWLIDDDGCNVMCTPDNEERFEGFSLYSHIAEKVHSAVPGQQLLEPVFKQFEITKLPKGISVIRLY